MLDNYHGVTFLDQGIESFQQSLSGGENQRVKLAYYLGQEKQQPTLFVFDEPTTGLHFHDIKTLLKAFNALIEKGHSVVLSSIIWMSSNVPDYVIDLGPEGGKAGGQLVCCRHTRRR